MDATFAPHWAPPLTRLPTNTEIVCATSFTLDVTLPDLFVGYLEFLNELTFELFGTIRYEAETSFSFASRVDLTSPPSLPTTLSLGLVASAA